jgi:hypothetical protein
MRLVRRLLLVWLVAACGILLPASPAEARLVAILFDTSGSMTNRYRLPSFGARLLAATINGTAGFDRLLAMNFTSYAERYGGAFPADWILDEYAGRYSGDLLLFEITNDSAHQQMIATLDRAFRSVRDQGTPYGPLEVMLDRIAREVEAAPGGEEVILVVVSDGAYHDQSDDFTGGRRVADMQAAFTGFRDRITAAGGSLRAEYLFIEVNTPELRAIVADQGVRDTFLSVFNGPSATPGQPLPGSRTVSSPDQLWDALVDIIASVSGTDRAAQSQFVTYSGSTITVDSPLTISRIVTVSTAPVSATLPARRTDDFPVAPTDDRRIEVAMDAEDPDFRGAPQRRGLVEHLWFQSGVPAGTYRLGFDAPVTENVFLLFETSAQVDLAVIDADGEAVLPGPDGVRTLYHGASYTFSSRIQDGLDAGGRPIVVEFDDLPQTLTMQLTLDGSVGPGTRSMTLDRAANAGTFSWTPEGEGELTAFARASAGILSPASPRLMLRVVDPATQLELTPLRSAAPCPGCGPDEVASPLQAGDEAVRVGEFDVIADGVMDGAVTFAPSDIPQGFELRDAAGNVIDPQAVIEFGMQDRRTFTLWRTDPDPEAIVRGLAELNLSVAPVGAWTGAPVSRETRVLLSPPEFSLVLVDVSEPITPGELDGLRVPGGELLLGNFAAQFSLVDILVPPSQETVASQVTVVSDRFMDRLVAFELVVPDPASVGFNALDVRPSGRYWCLCWIAAENAVLGTSRREVEITYSVTYVERVGFVEVPLQRASARLPLDLPVGTTLAGLSCAFNLLILFLTYVVLRGIWALVTTHRFPRGAHVAISDQDGRITTKNLDRGNTVWIKAWLAFLTGNPDEVRVVEGLRLRATRNGAILDVSRNTPNWRLSHAGGTFAELKVLDPKRTEYKIQWDDHFDSVMGPPRTAHLRKKR